MTKPPLTQDEKSTLEHRLAMYQQLTIMCSKDQKHLQKQAELLMLLGLVDEAELILIQLQNKLASLGLHDEAKKAKHIRQHINKEKLCEQLYATPFLHLASSSFLEKAFRIHRRLELIEGDYLIRHGEHETQMFILIQGELVVWSRDQHGRKHFEHTMQEGEVIGELAFLSNTPRSADVIASQASVVLTIPSAAVLKLFIDNPAVEQALRRSATARKIQMDIKKNAQLAKLPQDIQALLARHGHYKRFSALERIYQSKQNIETIDLVCAGYVRLIGELNDGRSIILNSLKVGSLLGCSATLPHMKKQYLADMVSMDETTVIRFPLNFFAKVMKTSPKLQNIVIAQAKLEHEDLLQTFSTQSLRL
ncbi:MAG: cyclic nucleotide-binding domain-containing protein [Ghiorsea sp.]|nr:cyclic nucleotide-binding domain-containing protein [Ghiorsea sp.]